MAVAFDPYSKEYFADPYPLFKRLRDEAPVYHNPERKFWALSRFADVYDAHHDTARFLSSGGVTIEGLEAALPLLIVKDGMEHTWHKILVAKVFTRTRMAALEPYIRRRVRELLDAAAAKPEFDFVKEFSVILPLDVISRLLDIPEERRAEYHDCTNRMLSRDEGHDLNMSRIAEAYQSLMEMFMALIAERRARPREDVITLLMDAEVKDENGVPRRLEDMEVAFRLNEMGAAGHETAAKAIANGAMAFCRFPDQRSLLRSNPDLMPRAVQEILRLEPPSQLQGRTTAVDVSLHGVTIPQGQKVMLLTGAACRDERVFSDPDRFDITREPDARSIYFGYGPHKCLGMHLATLEISVAFEELLSRYPGFEVDPAKAQYPIMTNVRGPAALPGRLGRSA